MADYSNTAPSASGLPFAWAPVRLVVTTNVDLQSFEPGASVDGKTVAEGDRVLLASQSTGSENGPYLMGAQGVTRASDADAAGEFSAGKFLRITDGDANAGTVWTLTTTGAITLGSTALTFTKGAPGEAAHNIPAGDNTLPGLSFPPTQDSQAFSDTAPSATGTGIVDFSNSAPSATVVP
jgi:hypothetical protein